MAFMEVLILLLLLRIDFASWYSKTRSREEPTSLLGRIKANCRKSYPAWRKSRCLAPDQLNVTFRPYDLGSDEKVTTGEEKELCDAGLDPGFRSALDWRERRRT